MSDLDLLHERVANLEVQVAGLMALARAQRAASQRGVTNLPTLPDLTEAQWAEISRQRGHAERNPGGD